MIEATSPLTSFVHDLRPADLPENASTFAKRWLLDLIGVGAAGSRTDLSAVIRNHAAAHFGSNRLSARMLFDGRSASPAGVALAGGMTIDALDAHDGHKLAKGHVGCAVLPTVFAFAEAEGRCDAREFLTALAIGYEIGTRAAIALHRTATDYHTSGAWVAVACAALGARALGLDAAKTREAIGIAEYHGPRSQMMRCIDHPTMLKDGSGWGAMAGVSAAYLAADGFTGAPAVTVEADDVADLWSDLGSRWRIVEQYFKPQPICRWAQPPVQAVLQLREEHGLSADQVDHIEVTTFHQAVRLAIRRPRTTEEAQYSTAFPVAAAMVRGKVGPDEVAPQAFEDRDILRLADGMRFVESDDYSQAFPERRFADVALALTDGRLVTSVRTESRGDPENPVSQDEVRAKFRAYAKPVLGQERALAIERQVDHLDRSGDVTPLFDLLTLPATEPQQSSRAS